MLPGLHAAESGGQRIEWMAGLKLVLSAPAIRGECLKITSQMQEALAEACSRRL
jgi:hypothetical protein